jgi:hypothetical protein
VIGDYLESKAARPERARPATYRIDDFLLVGESQWSFYALNLLRFYGV